jgi:hypothetical protein
MLLCLRLMRKKMAPNTSALFRLDRKRERALSLSRVIWRQLRTSSSRNCLRGSGEVCVGGGGARVEHVAGVPYMCI